MVSRGRAVQEGDGEEVSETFLPRCTNTRRCTSEAKRKRKIEMEKSSEPTQESAFLFSSF